MDKSKSVLLNNLYIQGFDPQQQRPASQNRSTKSLSNYKKAYIRTQQVLRGGDVVPRGQYIFFRQTKYPNYYYFYWILFVLITTVIILIPFVYNND